MFIIGHSLILPSTPTGVSDGQKCDFGGIDDRRKGLDAKHPEVRNSEGAAGRGQALGPGPANQVAQPRETPCCRTVTFK